MNTKFLLIVLCLTGLPIGLCAQGFVLIPTLSLDENALPTRVDAIEGRPFRVLLSQDGSAISGVRWFRDVTPIHVGTGPAYDIESLDYWDSGWYFARYSVGGVERQSQSMLLVVRPTARLLNISTRCLVTDTKPAIAGFVVSEPAGRKQFLIRAVGPSLADHGVAEPLARPTMRLFQGSNEVLSFVPQRNGNADSLIVAATRSTGAFVLEDGTHDLTALVALQTGLFTVHVGTEDGTAGEVLVEVYEYE